MYLSWFNNADAEVMDGHVMFPLDFISNPKCILVDFQEALLDGGAKQVSG
jgi:hypothetical protein